MQQRSWTVASVNALLSDIKQRLDNLLRVKHSALTQALARGLGFNTEAALKAALKSDPVLPAGAFDATAFSRRVEELQSDVPAEAVFEILNGVELHVDVAKRSERRQRAEIYSDIAYDVTMTASLPGGLAKALNGDVEFLVPEFGTGTGHEPYRVDSAHEHRVVSQPSITRGAQGKSTLRAKLVNGKWRGSFHVYSQEHKADDTRCIRSLKAALARAVLAQLPTGVRCMIFRPDGYDFGAWRIELRLPQDVLRLWGDAPLQFDLPKLPHRHFIAQGNHGVGVRVGRFVNGIWKADLYTNGVAEKVNPTSLMQVKRALLDVVVTQTYRAGHLEEGRLMPVLNVDGDFMGTVSLRNGRYEAWRRTINLDGRRVHQFLGGIESLDHATSLIRNGVGPGSSGFNVPISTQEG